MGQGQSGCERCGAANAELYANDGARVCDRCFAYDQVVTGELRASQVDLGVTPTGEGTNLVEVSLRKSRNALLLSLVLAGATAGLFYAAVHHFELAFIGGTVTAVLTLFTLVRGIKLRSFAKVEAPVVEKRLSSRPPAPMKDPITVPQTRR